METTLLLKLNDLSDSFILNGLQLLRLCLALGDSITLLDQLIRTQQRANVLGSERWASLSGRHLVRKYIQCFQLRYHGKEKRGKLFSIAPPQYTRFEALVEL